MNFIGDLALAIGALGVVVYLCLIVIRYTSRASQLKDRVGQYEERFARLEQQRAELETRRQAIDPEVDALVRNMIALRERRDRLHFQYEEMEARSREREIHIKSNVR